MERNSCSARSRALTSAVLFPSHRHDCELKAFYGNEARRRFSPSQDINVSKLPTESVMRIGEAHGLCEQVAQPFRQGRPDAECLPWLETGERARKVNSRTHEGNDD
jgi:hypothetical protein